MQIEFQNLSKRYRKDIYGVRDVSITIGEGVYGLIGRNGAGKTTLLNMLATILPPTSGKILFDGKDLERNQREFRASLGFLPQDTKLQPSLTAYEFLDYICLLKGIRDKKRRGAEIERSLAIVGLSGESGKKLGAYSGGMLRRAGIAQALLGNPKVMILDEPTTGLDPEERLYFKNLISQIGRDRTVILSTHIITDIQDICGEVCILDGGRAVYSGGVNELIGRVSGKVWECEVAPEQEEQVRTKSTATAVTYKKDASKIRYISGQSVFPGSENRQATLEDAYIFSVGGVKR